MAATGGTSRIVPGQLNGPQGCSTDCAGAVVANGSDVTSYTGAASGTYYVQVIEGSSGADGAFMLTASVS